MDDRMWTRFFEAAGIASERAVYYADIFSTHKIERNHLPHLNREVLKEMNITLMGHIRLILKHAQVVSERMAHHAPTHKKVAVSRSEEEIQNDGIIRVEMVPNKSYAVASTSQHTLSQVECLSTAGQFNIPDTFQCLETTNSNKGNVKPKHQIAQSYNCDNSQLPNTTVASNCYTEKLKANIPSCEIVERCGSPQSYNSKREMSQGSVESQATTLPEARTALLPTPTMPKNWLDPSWKGDSGKREGAEVLQGNPDLGPVEVIDKMAKEMSEYCEQSMDLMSSVPDKRPIALLPTPPVPQNWLNPCRTHSEESQTLTSKTDVVSSSVHSTVNSECFNSSVSRPQKVLNQQDGYLSINPTSATHSKFKPLHNTNDVMNSGLQSNQSSEKCVLLQHSIRPQYPMQSRIGTNILPTRERNMKAKNAIFPKAGWSSQTGRAQPYSRQQQYQTYPSESSSFLHPGSRANIQFSTNAFQSYNVRPSYHYTSQYNAVANQEFLWKNN